MPRKSLIFLIFIFTSSLVNARTIASYGGIYPVEEIDIREVIFKRLNDMDKSGELMNYQERASNHVKEQIERPEPLGLSTTLNPKTYYVSPTVTVNHDIYNADGVLIAQKGTAINPFEKIRFKKALMFFDADDEKQVVWVKEHYSNYPHVKFILTGGSVLEASKLFGRVYFDWQGALTRKLHIKHVPSVVEQKGLQWQIMEGRVA
ncbi:type-F conjugative transfer system protein TraW [Legionella impletisoli]|uniref:Type-F conjugative transfer system protein TraW n=1 Tax=Legionella impletisoli TaxID=343510 RepID=A0A917K0C5_9GAMM|nr:type-F conjugative transfer system protein TraW [Legionella impletisoli]GGI90943.1 hypothetical protein GCM10007966_19560 [Legionella impletisoli]